MFNPKGGENTHRIFKLTKVQPKYESQTYATLDERDRVKLNDTIIHATIVKQESPAGEDTSIYHIFERLNNGGRRLAPQEIRVAIYHGRLLDRIKDMNNYEKWRSIYGRQSPRLKDEELILRYLSFYDNAESYKRPMNEFINIFAARNRNQADSRLDDWQRAFESSISLLHDTVGKATFRPEASINAAVFDSVMVGIGRRLASSSIANASDIKAAYEALLADADYVEATSRSTADEKFVKKRIQLSTDVFHNI